MSLESPIKTPIINIYGPADLRRYAEGMIWRTYFSTRDLSSTWRTILDGKVSNRNPVPEGCVHKSDLLDFLVQFLRYIRQTEPTLVAVRDTLSEHSNPKYRQVISQHFHRHANQELDHDILLEGDIRLLGFNPDRAQALYPPIEAITKYVKRAKSMSRNPDLAIAKLMEGILLEGQAAIWSGNFSTNLEMYGDFPEKHNVSEFFKLHDEADASSREKKGHMDLGLKLLEAEGLIEWHDYPKLIAEAELVSGFYIQFALALHERSLERRLGLEIK